jgi:hypothetical protein
MATGKKAGQCKAHAVLLAEQHATDGLDDVTRVLQGRPRSGGGSQEPLNEGCPF